MSKIVQFAEKWHIATLKTKWKITHILLGIPARITLPYPLPVIYFIKLRLF